jgi:glutaredoxin
MDLCRGGRGTKEHEEICYEGNSCPFCERLEELAGEMADLQGVITSKQQTIEDLESTIEKLESE